MEATETSAPAAETTEASRPADASPTPAPTTRESFDFDAVWGETVVKANADRPSGPPTDPAAEGEPADKASKPAAAPDATDAGTRDAAPPKPADGEAAAAEQPLSRRQQAEQDRQKELADLRSQWEASETAKRAAEQRAAEIEAAQKQAEAEVAKLIGGDDEFAQLDRQPYSSLSIEQQDQLDLWKANRLHFAPVHDYLSAKASEAAEQRVAAATTQAETTVNAYREAIAQGLGKALSAHPSVDAKTIQGATDWSVIAETLIAAGAREQAEKDQAAIAKLTAERDQARAGGFASLRRPERGGSSGGDTSGPRFDPRKSAADNFDAAFGASTDVPNRARAS